MAWHREHVVMLADWTDEDPARVLTKLKQQPDYYNYRQRTLGTFLRDVRRDGLRATLAERAMWARMRMSASDLADVSGATYTYLMNGQPPAANWTGLVAKGEPVRLRFINGSAMTYFDVRIPGVTMTVVAADGLPVQPVSVDEFRIAVAETYDVIVTPTDDAHTIMAQAFDCTGYAAGTGGARRAVGPGAAARPAAVADHGRNGARWGARQHGARRAPDRRVDGGFRMPDTRCRRARRRPRPTRTEDTRCRRPPPPPRPTRTEDTRRRRPPPR